MRKISLISYKTAGGRDFEVKKAMAALLFIPELKLGARDIIENDRIARKIEAAGDSVLLEEAEYTRVKTAHDVFLGYGRDDIEFIARIRDAQEIDANTPITKEV